MEAQRNCFLPALNLEQPRGRAKWSSGDWLLLFQYPVIGGLLAAFKSGSVLASRCVAMERLR
jgi:hypothetical protein